MFRIYIPIVLIALFVLWVLYRLVIKKDLKQNLQGLYLGLLFIGIWGLIYSFIFR